MSLQTRDRRRRATCFEPVAGHAVQIVMNSPVLSQRKLRQIVALADQGVPNAFIDLHVRPGRGPPTPRCVASAREAEAAVRDGALVTAAVGPSTWCAKSCAMHALLATGAVHHHLIKRACGALQHRCVRDRRPRATRTTSPVSSATAPPRCIRTWRTSRCTTCIAQGQASSSTAASGGAGRSYRKAITQGPAEDHLEDGYLDDRQLPRRRLFEIVGLADEVAQLCFHGTRQPHRRRATSRTCSGRTSRRCAAAPGSDAADAPSTAGC